MSKSKSLQLKTQAFLVMVAGYWGRGPTLKEAAAMCRKQGAGIWDTTVMYIVLGDDKPTVNDLGDICLAPGAEYLRLGKGVKLGPLLKLE